MKQSYSCELLIIILFTLLYSKVYLSSLPKGFYQSNPGPKLQRCMLLQKDGPGAHVTPVYLNTEGVKKRRRRQPFGKTAERRLEGFHGVQGH